MKRSLAASLAAAAFSTLLACSSHAATFVYQAVMDGPSEFPVNASPGNGFAQVIYDDAAHTLTISATFSGLTGTTTAAHIHASVPDPPSNPTAGVATQLPSFTTFPLGVTSGSMPVTEYDLTLASSWNPSFVTANGGTPAGAEAALIAAMNSATHPTLPSRAYFNVHTSTFPGGEIRGFLTLVPEPSTIGLASTTLLGLAAARRRRK
jgi:hypothetical protein